METLINPLEILLRINERLDRIESQLVNINETLSNRKINTVLTTKETCKYLHVSNRSLQLYRDNGNIDFVQIGRKVLFRSEDLDRFMEQHHIKTKNVGR